MDAARSSRRDRRARRRSPWSRHPPRHPKPQRSALMPRPPAVLVFDDGTNWPGPASGWVLLGRSPAPAFGEASAQLVSLVDESMRISKTHAAFGIDDTGAGSPTAPRRTAPWCTLPTGPAAALNPACRRRWRRRPGRCSAAAASPCTRRSRKVGHEAQARTPTPGRPPSSRRRDGGLDGDGRGHRTGDRRQRSALVAARARTACRAHPRGGAARRRASLGGLAPDLLIGDAPIGSGFNAAVVTHAVGGAVGGDGAAAATMRPAGPTPDASSRCGAATA